MRIPIYGYKINTKGSPDQIKSIGLIFKNSSQDKALGAIKSILSGFVPGEYLDKFSRHLNSFGKLLKMRALKHFLKFTQYLMLFTQCVEQIY